MNSVFCIPYFIYGPNNLLKVTFLNFRVYTRKCLNQHRKRIRLSVSKTEKCNLF